MSEKYLCLCGWIVRKNDYLLKHWSWKCYRCGSEFGYMVEKPTEDLVLMDAAWYKKRHDKLNLKEGDVLYNKYRKLYFRIIKPFTTYDDEKDEHHHKTSTYRRTLEDAKRTHMTSTMDVDTVLLDCKKIVEV